jgi:hypothetical protein
LRCVERVNHDQTTAGQEPRVINVPALANSCSTESDRNAPVLKKWSAKAERKATDKVAKMAKAAAKAEHKAIVKVAKTENAVKFASKDGECNSWKPEEFDCGQKPHDDCRRCIQILGKRKNTVTPHLCDVGMKSIFRSIRRCSAKFAV